MSVMSQSTVRPCRSGIALGNGILHEAKIPSSMFAWNQGGSRGKYGDVWNEEARTTLTIYPVWKLAKDRACGEMTGVIGEHETMIRDCVRKVEENAMLLQKTQYEIEVCLAILSAVLEIVITGGGLHREENTVWLEHHLHNLEDRLILENARLEVQR